MWGAICDSPIAFSRKIYPTLVCAGRGLVPVLALGLVAFFGLIAVVRCVLSPRPSEAIVGLFPGSWTKPWGSLFRTGGSAFRVRS